jgi:hypothetical protein
MLLCKMYVVRWVRLRMLCEKSRVEVNSGGKRKTQANDEEGAVDVGSRSRVEGATDAKSQMVFIY